MTTERGKYGEILLASLAPTTRKAVQNLVAEIARADTVDEHGGWKFGADFDEKGRGTARNWALYAVGRDCHSRKLLAVVQVRQYYVRHKKWWPEIRKNYFLIGRNEDGTAFAHSVSAAAARAACKKERPIEAMQNWIFGGDYTKMCRQGDFAAIPSKRPPKDAKPENPALILSGSHYLIADQIVRNGALYARGPSLYHLPNTHPDLENLPGWWKIIEGRRGRFWSFATPTVD